MRRARIAAVLGAPMPTKHVLRPANARAATTVTITGVCHVPRGAYPSYTQDYDRRDNAFYQAWDGLSRDRGIFTAWIDRHVRGTRDHAEFLASVAEAQA